MNKAIILVCILVNAVLLNGQQTDFSKMKGPYLGQKTPGNTPEIFAPGIVSKDGIQSKLLLSPDGSEIIFMNLSFAGNNPAGRKSSFMSIRKEKDDWGTPVEIPFSLEYMNDEPALSPDGQKLFFVSNRPVTGNGDPAKMPDIWVSERTGTGWSEPANTGAPVNTDGVEVQPFYSSTDKLYFGRIDGIYCSQYSEGHFSEPVKFGTDILKGRVRGICFSPDNKVLIVHSDMQGGYGSWDLYISFLDETGNWTQLINLGNGINTEKPEANATFSPDGKYIFFSRGDDIYWVSAEIIEELRPKD